MSESNENATAKMKKTNKQTNHHLFTLLKIWMTTNHTSLCELYLSTLLLSL